MKKMLSVLLALAMTAAGVISAFPVVCAADDHGTNVTATVEPPSDRPIKVDITWSTMEFTYTDGGWDPETHSYHAGSWTTDGGEIAARNNGTVAIDTAFAYTPADGISGITGTFSNVTLNLPVGERGSTVLSLSGKPAQALDNTPIGTVTITITAAQEQNP